VLKITLINRRYRPLSLYDRRIFGYSERFRLIGDKQSVLKRLLRLLLMDTRAGLFRRELTICQLPFVSYSPESARFALKRRIGLLPKIVARRDKLQSVIVH